jgi:hypothetical protein
LIRSLRVSRRWGGGTGSRDGEEGGGGNDGEGVNSRRGGEIRRVREGTREKNVWILKISLKDFLKENREQRKGKLF